MAKINQKFQKKSIYIEQKPLNCNIEKLMTNERTLERQKIVKNT